MGNKSKSKKIQSKSQQNGINGSESEPTLKNMDESLSGSWQINTKKKNKPQNVEEVPILSVPLPHSEIPIVEKKAPPVSELVDEEFLKMIDQAKDKSIEYVRLSVAELITKIEGFEYKLINKISSHFDEIKNRCNDRQFNRTSSLSVHDNDTVKRIAEIPSSGVNNDVFTKPEDTIVDSDREKSQKTINGVVSVSSSKNNAQGPTIIVSDRTKQRGVTNHVAVSHGPKNSTSNFTGPSSNSLNKKEPLPVKKNTGVASETPQSIQKNSPKVSDRMEKKKPQKPHFDSKLTEETYRWFVESAKAKL